MTSVKYTSEQIKEMKSETDLDRVLSIRDEEILYDEDSPDIGAAIETGTMKRRGRPRLPDKKVPVSVRLEPDVLALLRSSGPGWQTKLSNAISEWARTNVL
jgi:uncharacterized protein (DUF4415 family)